MVGSAQAKKENQRQRKLKSFQSQHKAIENSSKSHDWSHACQMTHKFQQNALSLQKVIAHFDIHHLQKFKPSMDIGQKDTTEGQYDATQS